MVLFISGSVAGENSEEYYEIEVYIMGRKSPTEDIRMKITFKSSETDFIFLPNEKNVLHDD